MKAIFVTREFGKNPADITREEFIKMVIEDIEKAKVAYRQWSDEEAEQRYEEDCERYAERREQKILDITNASYKKYKREYYRQRWVMQEVAKIPQTIARGYWHFGKELTSIRWDYKPWENSCTYIDIKTDVEGKIERIYNELINNKYFLQSTGWSIVEDFTTEFRFHLSGGLIAEWQADEKRLSDDINRFYAGTNYCGD